MKKNQNPFVQKVLQDVLNSGNELDAFFAKDILQHEEPFAYLDEIIQRGFGINEHAWINKKSVTADLFINNMLTVKRHLQKYIDRGAISQDYILLNDSITIIQFVYKNRCLDFYKQILKEAGCL